MTQTTWLSGPPAFEVGQLLHGEDITGKKATGWTFFGVIAGIFGYKKLGGAADEVIESGSKSADNVADGAARMGKTTRRMADAVDDVAPKVTEAIIDSTKFSSKVRSKLNQLRKKYPHVRRGADGAADAQKLAEAAFRRGGGRVGPPVGQGAKSALYFDDGPVTWVFKPDGTFWSMRTNSGWTP